MLACLVCFHVYVFIYLFISLVFYGDTNLCEVEVPGIFATLVRPYLERSSRTFTMELFAKIVKYS